MKDKEKKPTNEKPVSLATLRFTEALAALLRVKLKDEDEQEKEEKQEKKQKKSSGEAGLFRNFTIHFLLCNLSNHFNSFIYSFLLVP